MGNRGWNVSPQRTNARLGVRQLVENGDDKRDLHDAWVCPIEGGPKAIGNANAEPWETPNGWSVL